MGSRRSCEFLTVRPTNAIAGSVDTEKPQCPDVMRAPKYWARMRSNTESGPATLANRVALDFSFMSSGEPKIS